MACCISEYKLELRRHGDQVASLLEKRELYSPLTCYIISMTNVISFYLVHLSMTIVISIDGLDDDVRCRTISFDHLK